MTALLELAERVERATGPDREMDAEIALLAQELPYLIPPEQAATKRFVTDCDGTIRILWTAVKPLLTSYASFNYNPLPVTASLDAAMTLVPEGCEWGAGSWGNPDTDGPWAWCATRPQSADNDLDYGKGTTPALALCAASLRARAAQGGEQ